MYTAPLNNRAFLYFAGRMLFSDLIGLEALSEKLVQMVDNNRLSHALLFLGKEGSGALPMAMALAHYVVSKPAAAPPMPDIFGGLSTPAPAVTAQNIQQIAAYQRAAQLSHPDVHYTFPTYKPDGKASDYKPISDDFLPQWRSFVASQPYGNAYDWLQHIKAENKQGNITAEECRELVHRLALKPFESEYKVLLLWMPEYLGNEGNILLKLIEEPPPNTLFILVAQEEDKVLSTILSRCQTIRVPYPSDEALAAALTLKHAVPAAQAAAVAGMAAGNMREAMLLLKRSEDPLMPVIRNWLNAMIRNDDGTELYRWVEEQAKMGKENIKQLLMTLVDLIQQTLKVQVAGEQAVLLPDDEKQFCVRLAKRLPTACAAPMVAELEQAVYYIERNANARMLLHALSIKIKYLLANSVLLSVY